MNNLGMYQSMTTWAKKVGGPRKLIFLIGISGYGVFRLGEAGAKYTVRKLKKHFEKQVDIDTKTYTVHSEGISNEGVRFSVNDKFRVLEIDKDAVLIEKIGESDNPYFVSAKLLHSISSFNL